MNYVTGIDLSLTATGVCAAKLDWGIRDWYTDTLKPPKMSGLPRLDWLVARIVEHCPAKALIVMEGPAFGAKGSAYHQLAGLWWIVRRELRLQRPDSAVAVVPPSNLKRIALGKGVGDKDAVMLATARRFPGFQGDNNAADALWLAVLGAQRMSKPLVELPAANLKALDGVTWP